MRQYTYNEVKKILEDLNNGEIYCGIDQSGCGVGTIMKTISGNLGWRHYGESANEFTVDGLEFVLYCIFSDCEEITPAIFSEYHINYIPKDGKYKGIDMSRKHPNTFGK